MNNQKEKEGLPLPSLGEAGGNGIFTSSLPLASSPICIHHFLIPARGLTVIGTCKKCGAERKFSNILNDSYDSWRVTSEKRRERARRGIEKKREKRKEERKEKEKSLL